MTSKIVGLGLFSLQRRASAPADDLDVALAGAQVGLEKKRQRWLLFLIEKEQQCLDRIAETAELDISNDSRGSIAGDAATWNASPSASVAEIHNRSQDSHDL